MAAAGARCLVFREVRRMGEQAVNLRPGRAVVFDGRFRVKAQREGFVLHSGAALTRAALETWLGLEIDLPMAAVQGAPVVHGQDGEIVAIGTHVREAHLGVIRLATAFAPRR